MDRIDLLGLSTEEIENALGGDDKVAVVRGSRESFARNQRKQSNPGRKKRVSFSLPAGDEGQYPTVVYPEHESRDMPPERPLPLQKPAPTKEVPNPLDKSCQTDDVDLSEFQDHGLFEDIDVEDILVATARDINAEEFRPKARTRSTAGPSFSWSTTSEVFSPSREHNKRLARRNTKLSKGTSFPQRVSIIMNKLTKDMLQEESDSSSPSEWTSEWSSDEYYSDERDTEWISSEGSDNPLDETEVVYDEKMKENAKKSKSGDKNPECARLMRYLNLLLVPLKLTGRFPFQTYKEDGLIKFRARKLSLAYIYFCFTTAFLVFNTCLMAQGFALVTREESGTENFFKQVERRLLDKYFYFALSTFFYCLQASIWSLAAIFEEGEALANYMTDFNALVVTLKYSPYEGIVGRILLQQIWFIGYVFFFIFFLYFEFEAFDFVHGLCDLVGLLIFVPFEEEVIFSQYHYLIQYYGLAAHLYAIYSSNCVTMLAVTYAHVLENMARLWNVRLAYALGMLGRQEENKAITYHTMIPYEKLFLEQKSIVDTLRQCGDVFTVGLGAYFGIKYFEMLLLGYRAMSVSIFPIVRFKEVYIEGLPPHLPKFMYSDPKMTILLTSIYALIQSVLGWFITTLWLAECGHAIMGGFEFIRRYGLVLSRTSIQRRFVLSITSVFAPIGDCYMRATFTINRPYIYDTFFWVMTMLSLFTAFSPLQLQRELITVCNTGGSCVAVHATRILYNVGNPLDVTSHQNDLLNITEPSIQPVTMPPPRYFYDCDGTWVLKGETSTVKVALPTACDATGSEITQRYSFGKSSGPCPTTNFLSAFSKQPQVFSCDPSFSKDPVGTDPADVDACGNLKLPIRKSPSAPALAFPRLRPVLLRGFINVDTILCCFDYEIPDSNQHSFCNVPGDKVAENICAEADSSITAQRLDKYDKEVENFLERTHPMAKNPTFSQNMEDCICEGQPPCPQQ